MQLFCQGGCGTAYLDEIPGCQQSDANAYCKLKLCNVNAIAKSYEVKDATNNPGFACKGMGATRDYGNWFGMTNVHFEDDLRYAHGSHSVVSNIVCEIETQSGNYNHHSQAR